MNFTLSDEQKLLQDSVDRFVEKEYAFDARRKILESDLGFSRDNWASFAELGWLAAPLPEDHGGLSGSAVDVAVIMEGLGRGLVLEPYVPSVVLGGGLVAAAGNDEQKARILPAVAEGTMLLAFAHVEPQARFDLFDIQCSATVDGDGFVLSGDKSVVFYGDSADTLIVAARTAGGQRDRDGIGLFIVAADAAGVSRRPYPTVDGLRGAEVHLENARVTAADVLGAPGDALAVIETVVDRAITAVCAEALGAMEVLIKMTQEHLKTREQFGVPIGAFQVLQHKVVDMFTAHELSKALTYRAAAAMSSGDATERARAASAAKTQVGRAGKFIGQSAVQLHGGMGMTDELSVGHYFKRLSMIDVQFGNADHHLSRFADIG